MLRRFIYPLGAGLAIGSAFVLLRVLPVLVDVSIPKRLRVFSEAVNTPALWAAALWSSTGLPGAGKRDDLVMPSILILVQWLLFAFLLSFWRRRRRDLHSNPQ